MAKRTPNTTLSGADRALQIGMAVAGAILLIGSLGVIVSGAVKPHRPAFVEVRETERDVFSGRTRVQVEAVNLGDETASAVTVEGQAARKTPASVTIDYVPGRSRKAATLTFQDDIGEAALILEATGWVEP